MRQLFEDIQEALDSLLQSGYSSVPPAVREKYSALSIQCEDYGLHTGAEIMKTLGQQLEARGHTMKKDDLAITDTVCRAVRYLSLCREHYDTTETARRWQSLEDETEEQ